MLTVEIRDPEKASIGEAVVEIHCDSDGLELLLYQLGHLKTRETHVHLMTPAWAGDELSEDRSNRDANTVIVNHLKVIKIPDN